MDYAALVEQYGGVNKAARAIGLAPSTFKGRLRSVAAPNQDDLEYPDLPSSELPPDQLIDEACRRFATRIAAKDARRWFEIKIKTNKPIGVCLMGDPHIDDPGCNWPLLRNHIQVLENTPGLYAVGCNDLMNSWIGRLVRLYQDQDMTRKQAIKLAAWLLRDSKVKWLCHVLGNHDSWGDTPFLLKANAQPLVPVEDWQARFQLVFPNGSRTRIHMSHDFKGNSMWNSLHGAQKQAMFGEDADIFSCAHKHCWAMHMEENSQRGQVYWLARSRGYKMIDSYAENLGFGNQRYGASITAVIDPTGVGPTRVQCFPDVGEAAEYLTWKRSR